jgi:hypothetical protein
MAFFEKTRILATLTNLCRFRFRYIAEEGTDLNHQFLNVLDTPAHLSKTEKTPT